ncbi:Jag N-terminal domain-containing protein [Clostridium chromiireducens]|uniref:Jag N-terminal domain-containing protein n=1 Tax=Clostridium chromiireducens TaxID=225345 RepID=UPI001FA9DF2C|nr:Jag N-terminal domain-containing protein [Clostridium chromiireducens]
MSLIYSGKSLDECLDNASKELNLLKEEIKYKIIKEKHSLISKKFEIQVEEFQLDSSNFKSSFKGDIKTNNKEHNSILYNQLIRSSVENGAKVESGKIIVTDNDLGEITIKSCDNIKLYINGELCNEKRAYKVTQFDKISYKGVKTEASKNVKITISKDKMEAYICIEYIPEYIYKLKDKPNLMNLALKAMKIQGDLPVKYKRNIKTK